MTDKPKNPPVFPREHRSIGMTLRDYYAGQALAGSCALPDMRTVKDSIIAEAAYSLADAMLKERGK